MSPVSLADQLYQSLIVVNLQQAAESRPLSQSERSLMEQAEAKAGPMLKDLQASIAQVRAHDAEEGAPLG